MIRHGQRGRAAVRVSAPQGNMLALPDYLKAQASQRVQNSLWERQLETWAWLLIKFNSCCRATSAPRQAPLENVWKEGREPQVQRIVQRVRGLRRQEPVALAPRMQFPFVELYQGGLWRNSEQSGDVFDG
jgi:hypothetical protein